MPSKNLAEMMEYLIEDERKAVTEYAHLYLMFVRKNAHKKILDRIRAIGEQERNHYMLLKEIYEKYFR